ncbi:MAG: metallophosphoesterase [Bacilli bacterium]|nr:metallophosphoesterase [Bacilli bacterium]
MAIKKVRIRKWVKIISFLILVISSFCLYSRFLGTNGLVIKERAIIDSNLPKNFYGLKIVQISDIHYKVTTSKEELKEIVEEINLLKPDIVVLTGDLFDSNIKYKKNDYEDVIKLLNQIDCNIDKYAIKGEDDLKTNRWEDVISASNFIDLNDKHELIYSNGLDPLLLVGISSNYKKNHIKKTLTSIYEEINVEYKYSILLTHEPDVIDDIDYSKFNLILAGHTHGGQVKLPFIGGIIKDKYAKVYTNDYYDLGNTKLYISSGIGTSKYKFRLSNKPSFNFYRLRNN